MELRLIEEMAKMKGGRGRLKKIREECEVDRDRLEGMIDAITDVLTRDANDELQEPVDSIGE